MTKFFIDEENGHLCWEPEDGETELEAFRNAIGTVKEIAVGLKEAGNG